MNFLAPGAFFLGFLLPIIIALYLLKLRRVERSVPSNYLWRRMVRDVEANAPWQKLRVNWLMVLQLLTLAALILALTRPFTWSEGSGGTAAILILDSSASMAATDVAPSRIESAKERARQLVDEMPDSARATIIEAGREARVLLSSSLDRRQAHLAIGQISAGTGSSDLAVALELASAIASRQTGTEIIVLSDGKAELPKRLVVKGQLRYIPFGLSAENQAISLLTLDKSTGGALTAFVQVSNYGEKASSCRVAILADDKLVNVVDLEDIPPGGQKSIIEENIDSKTSVVSAQLMAQDDSLALDNAAWAVSPDTQPVLVTLVTQGNRFIKTALTLLPGVVLTEQAQPLAAADASPEPTLEPALSAAENLANTAGLTDENSAAALWIYDNIVPTQLPPSGSLLFIAPPASTEYFTTTGLVKNPTIRPVDPADPLLDHLSLSEVNILDAVQIPLPTWATPVVAGDLATGNTPLIFRGTVNGRRIAVVAFDLRHSDLPLQVSFPILLANLVNWLAPSAGSALPAQVNPGESISFSAVEYEPDAVMTLPDGSIQKLQAVNNRFTITDTTQLGLYMLQLTRPASGNPAQGRTATFAVNLFSPQESNVKPASSLTGVEVEGGNGALTTRQAMREWWRALALLALGFLMGEWMVYQRSALARIRDMLGKLHWNLNRTK